MLVLNLLLGPKNPSAIKSEPFECGQVQITSPRQRFSVKFYLIAIVFIVFDIEVVFLIPWAVLYRWFLTQPSWAVLAFTEMLVFLGILGLGLAYFWKRRGLEWD
ncbi:MAG: NADH-quinone oxidoreductase subunit A [Myxococcales bacterium]|nr:NADH-quinone oxidoreductase subunit A [Myxococcales bacterium]